MRLLKGLLKENREKRNIDSLIPRLRSNEWKKSETSLFERIKFYKNN